MRQKAFLIAFLAGVQAWAIAPHQVDDFQNGTTQGWAGGDTLANVTGGQGGATDRYLRATSRGGAGPGSRLGIQNALQWTGNYTAAGVVAVRADVRNPSTADLALRVLLFGPGGEFTSTVPVALPAGGNWQSITFSLSPSALTFVGFGMGNLQTTLGGVTRIIIRHQTGAPDGSGGGGTPIVATLWIDDITAVPAPAPKIDVTPPDLPFGDVQVGSQGSLSFTIRNTGEADLHISSVALASGTSTDFAITSGSGAGTLTPGDERIVQVSYTPGGAGPDTGSVAVASDDPARPTLNVPLSGNGVQAPGAPFRRAEANQDNALDIGDAVRILGFFFLQDPLDCEAAADVNDDGQYDIADPIRLLDYLFAGGAQPPPPFEACGLDPTADTLTCVEFAPCP